MESYVQLGIDLAKLQQVQLKCSRDVLASINNLVALLNSLESACSEGNCCYTSRTCTEMIVI